MDPLPDPLPLWAPPDLWPQVRLRTAHALAAGVLRPIVTEERTIEQGGVGFAVRVVSSLKAKDRARAGGGAKGQGIDRMAPARPKNPFLPYDRGLFVADLSATHVALLNKFPVLEHHLLLVTRAFEGQEKALSRADLEALARALAGIDGLGFYNGGSAAGASQAHKHLQLVPLPLAATGPPVPIAPLLARASGSRLPGLRFRHGFAQLAPAAMSTPATAARALYDAYRRLRARLGLDRADPTGRLPPYNLLATRSWLLLVPRSSEHSHGVSVNALGFAGSLLVRDRTQMRSIIRHGPMTILEQVALTR